MKYNPQEIETKWQLEWEKQQTFAAGTTTQKPTFYVLDMFPYPSGKGLHVGHLKGYVASDVVSRFKRAQGFDVMHPMGWDSFGLPTERQAQKEGITPQEVTTRNIAAFKSQLTSVGLSYDWQREFATSDEKYYRWTQWIFLKLFEHGLAYLADVPVNWCPALKTVLANEEVVDGKYVETGDAVERKTMKQWMLRITAYADRLLEDLGEVNWPEPIKQMQRNWIGRSVGATVEFPVVGSDVSIPVFTTRPETLFGVTYLVVAPEHELLGSIVSEGQRSAVDAYCNNAIQQSDRERRSSKGKTGVVTGGLVRHPLTGEELPVWVADYVLLGFGTGAVMAVPAHDDRDKEFAAEYSLEVRKVIVASSDGQEVMANSLVEGLSINGLTVDEGRSKVIAWLEESGNGQAETQYRLRDWLFSRQRYWGEPIPIAYRGSEIVGAPEHDLPITLPSPDQIAMPEEMSDVETPRAPLASARPEWLEVEVEGEIFQRETNTMPQWAGSCWYYLRFIDPDNEDAPCDKDKQERWLPVDLYVGGAEHATLHLLYARFWHKFLFDIGVVSSIEPFGRLFNQGMIHATSFRDDRGKYYYEEEVEKNSEGQFAVRATGEPVKSQVEKMSKSKCNGLPPEDVIADAGADSLRLYEMFMGPVEDGGMWDTNGVRGTRRFLDRLWRLAQDRTDPSATVDGNLYRELHVTIMKVTQAIESLQLNTAISQLMKLLNVAYESSHVPPSFIRTFSQLLQPFAPHIAEELWEQAGGEGLVSLAVWPLADEEACVTETVKIGVQVNGKVRGTVSLPVDCERNDAIATAQSDANINKYLEGVSVGEVIFVPNRIINFVLSK